MQKGLKLIGLLEDSRHTCLHIKSCFSSLKKMINLCRTGNNKYINRTYLKICLKTDFYFHTKILENYIKIFNSDVLYGQHMAVWIRLSRKILLFYLLRPKNTAATMMNRNKTPKTAPTTAPTILFSGAGPGLLSEIKR